MVSSLQPKSPIMPTMLKMLPEQEGGQPTNIPHLLTVCFFSFFLFFSFLKTPKVVFLNKQTKVDHRQASGSTKQCFSTEGRCVACHFHSGNTAWRFGLITEEIFVYFEELAVCYGTTACLWVWHFTLHIYKCGSCLGSRDDFLKTPKVVFLNKQTKVDHQQASGSTKQCFSMEGRCVACHFHSGNTAWRCGFIREKDTHRDLVVPHDR